MPLPDPDALFDALVTTAGDAPEGVEIGRSREGRPITGYRFGDGRLNINLVGGCHADEPVGPRLLAHLAALLSSPAGAPIRSLARWTVVPHVNPDGAAVNAPWQPPDASEYDFTALLRTRVRELPGDDIEFGFPRDAADEDARPENRAAEAFWREEAPYHLHMSLHGMSVAAGPWFLVERSWWPRFEAQARELAARVARDGYELHDVERHGEKGFHRLARGFCTRPDSRAMRQHFLDLGDPETASRFRPSSMEAVRAMGGDPLTLVSEMPLFITPGVGRELGPPDPVQERWKARIAEWTVALGDRGGAGRDPDDVAAEMRDAGLRPMPVVDQMRFQWAFLWAGIEACRAAGIAS